MEEFWTGNSFKVFQYFGKMKDIMTVDRAEISEVQTFEKIALVENGTFQSGFNL